MTESSIKTSKKDIFWNYLGYGISFGINIILLPFVLRFLPSNELGLWYTFVSIGSLITLFDFGFSPQIARSITYAFSGSKEILKYGMSEISGGGTNKVLVINIIKTAKGLYLIISLVALILLSIIAFPYLNHFNNLDLGLSIYIAWYIYAIGCFINLKYSYLNAVYRGIGDFSTLNKSIVISKFVQVIVTVILLLLNFGLIAVSIAYFANTIIFRLLLSYSFSAKLRLNAFPSSEISLKEKVNLFKVIWHNAWKDGIITLSKYAVTQANVIICSLSFGLIETASFALSAQLGTFIASISTIYYSTIQPALVEANIKQDTNKMKTLYSTAWILFFFSFTILVILTTLIGLPLLEALKSKTSINILFFISYSIFLFFDTNTSLAASYISTSNRLPYTVPFIISALLSLLCSIILSNYTALGIWSLLFSPLVVLLLYNGWKWPLIVARELKLRPIAMLNVTFLSIKNHLNNNLV